MALARYSVKGFILLRLDLFKLHCRDRWTLALGLAQAGEFGLFLVTSGWPQGLFQMMMARPCC